MSVEVNFEQVRNFLLRFNAFDFLSQFSMTYLFTREDQFVRESDEIHHDFRALEFASGFYGTIAPAEKGEWVNGSILEEYRHLVRSYFDAVNIDLLTNEIAKGEEQSSSSIVSAKLHSLYIRGDAYPHQFWDLAEAVFSPHSDWFKSHLGFTISESITIARTIEKEINDRYNAAKTEAQEGAPRIVREREQEWKQLGMTEEQALVSSGIGLLFGQSKEIYRLTIDQVSSRSGLNPLVCKAFFERLSQTPPYRSPFFPVTYTNALTAPWDYNVTKERPFFCDGTDFWIFAPHTLKEVLYSTFFFDLMNDQAYKGTFENSRGHVLEGLSSGFLKRAFPDNAVMLNPSYPNGEEFADVCVIFDGKIIIVQCKSKGLTLGAHTGEDLSALKRDLEKAIGNAAAQACKGRRYLEIEATPYLLSDGKRIDIDKSQINEIILIAVTYMPLHTFATRLREVEEDLGLPHNEFPVWALPIGDLDIVTQICNSPAKLLHYVRRRLLLEVGEKRIRGDEADLLAFYLDQGLWLGGEDMEEANLIALSGYSTSVDEFVFRRYDQGIDAPVPEVKRPPGFHALITDIESLSSRNRTDCALMLLDLSGEASQELMGLIQRTKERCIAREDTIPSSMGNDAPAWGMSIVAAPKTISPEEAFNRTQGFGQIKKYARRIHRWTALGWREGSTRSVDYAVWLDYPFERHAATDSLVQQIFGGAD